MSALLSIDGNILEGGGQVLRIAISLSTILSTPVKISNIRAGRSSPGLKAQHLTGVKLCASICGAQLEGTIENSTEISFRPSAIKSGSYYGDTHTAGSVGLMFQVALPPLLFAPNKSQLKLKGGTNADMAPQIDYTDKVFKHYLKMFGGNFDCQILRRGYYPKGGGEINISVDTINYLKSVELLDPGKIIQVKGYSYTAGVLPKKMAFEMAEAATRVLKAEVFDAQFDIDCVKEPEGRAVGNGSGIVLYAITSTGCIFGGSAVGKRGVSTEELGKKAAQEIINCIRSKACVDDHCMDQIILLMGLARGTSKVRCGPLTLHTKTAIYVVEQFLKIKFIVTQETDTSSIVSCNGIGHTNTSHQ